MSDGERRRGFGVLSVGANGAVREITVSWGSWRYTVTYSNLGTTAAPTAPANPRPLRER
jgi:hypothetical protein